MSQPSLNSPPEINPTQETGQPQPSAKSHNASKFAKRSLIGLSLVAIVVLLVVGVCNWLPPQMAKWELEEQGVMPDGYGQALLAACEKNAVKTVALLMTAGAKVNKADKDGETPLLVASGNGHTEIVKLLIEKGADVNKDDEDGQTPLYRASDNGLTEIVKLLIAAGADVNKADKYGRTPLYRAVYRAVYRRSLKGHTEIVKLLIAAGADVNKAGEGGETPLFWAIGHTEIVKLLVAAGADVNKADKDGRTPLQWASHFDLTESVKLLKSAGAKE